MEATDPALTSASRLDRRRGTEYLGEVSKKPPKKVDDVNALVEQHRERPVQEIVDVCVADYQAFRGRDSDDITLMVLRKVG